jgi:hypothetical protein
MSQVERSLGKQRPWKADRRTFDDNAGSNRLKVLYEVKKKHIKQTEVGEQFGFDAWQSGERERTPLRTATDIT